MQSATIHIALLCENQQHASSWVDLSKAIQEHVEIEIANNLQQLLQQVEKKTPDIIILFSNKPDNSVITYLKDIRHKDGETDEVPIFIYTTMPTAQDIKDLLKTVADNERERSQHQ